MGRTKTRLTGLERKNIYVGIEGKRRIKTAGSAYVQGQTEQGPGQSMGDSLLWIGIPCSTSFDTVILKSLLLLSSIKCSFIVANCDLPSFDFGVLYVESAGKTPTKNHKMLSVTIRKLSNSPIFFPIPTIFLFEPFGVCQFTSWVP